MTGSDHERLTDIFAEASKLLPGQRAGFLDSVCDGDVGLRKEVEELLALAERASRVFDVAQEQIVQPDPSRIGPYELLEQVGEGGMAVVYKAQQHRPVRRIVAVKLIKLGMDTRQFVSRFESERQALAMMEHPNVAQVYDAGSTDTGRPYFVMEYVEGRPILTWCDSLKLPIKQRLELFTTVCDAVEHAHRKGIIHRDLKSSNVLVAEIDGKPVPKVIDFGVAKLTASTFDTRTAQTEFGQMIGTPQYMSPEQLESGGVEVDTRADVYALGVMLYELLAGVQPIARDGLRTSSFDAIRQTIRNTEPAKPSTALSSLESNNATVLATHRGVRLQTLVRQLYNELEWIPLKAMRKDRDRRYRSAAELADDIQNYLNGRPLLAGPETRWYVARKFLARHRASTTTVAIVALLILAGVIAIAVQTVRARRAEAQARQSEVQAIVERDTAKATLQFLADDVLAGATPENIPDARVRDKIVSAMIEPAAKRVSESFRDRPIAEASVRESIQTVYREIGRAELALPHAEAALAIRRRELGNDHLDTIQSINDYGKVLRALGKFAEAEPFYKESLELRRRVQGKDHLDTLTSQNNYALILENLARFTESEPLLKDTLDRRRALLGDGHTSTIMSLNNYAHALFIQGKIAEAEPLYRDMLARRRRMQGDDHPLTLLAINNLADTLTRLGQLSEAEPLWQELLEGYRDVMGPDHPTTLTATSNYAFFLGRANRADEALTLHKQVLEQRTRVLGDEHPDTIFTLAQYARALSDAGRLEEAEPTARRAMELHRRRLGDDHPWTIRSAGIYAALMLSLGRVGEAEKMFQELHERSARVIGPNHQDTLHKLDCRVVILLQLNRAAEAEPIAREVVARALASTSLGPKHRDTLLYAARHAHCLDILGRGDDAAAIRKQFDVAKPATLPTTDPAR